jgi:hypothetical protein
MQPGSQRRLQKLPEIGPSCLNARAAGWMARAGQAAEEPDFFITSMSVTDSEFVGHGHRAAGLHSSDCSDATGQSLTWLLVKS